MIREDKTIYYALRKRGKKRVFWGNTGKTNLARMQK